jgi:cytosine/adenosine deaminase-related metal-dependent hydrolase
MSRLLLEHIDTLATFDEQRRVLRDAWVSLVDGAVEAVGTFGETPATADRRLDLSGYIVLPGLVNLHHHFFQSQLRNVPSLQDVSLFRWLHDIYLLMSEVRDEDLYVASQVAIAELLLSGCTTAVDHSYLKVNDMRFETEIAAAREMGIRFHLARGSFSLGQKDGALPPDHLVEKEDDILASTESLIKTWHDPSPRAMVRVDNAPCSPFSVAPRLWRESIELARRYGVGNHAHMAEAPDEVAYMIATFGRRSVELAEEWGWVGPDVWYAHATCLSSTEESIITRTHTGICSCPTSNMFTAARCCPIVPLLRAGGAKIGLGVDGGATNNSSNLLQEVRHALLMQRAFYGADALSATQALELATLGGASVLRRDDIGSLEPGKAADLIGYDTRRLSFAGGLFDPLAALVLCDAGPVDLSIINGKIRVEGGRLTGVDLLALIKRQNKLAAQLLARAERRYDLGSNRLVWRRAYPYEGRA